MQDISFEEWDAFNRLEREFLEKEVSLEFVLAKEGWVPASEGRLTKWKKNGQIISVNFDKENGIEFYTDSKTLRYGTVWDLVLDKNDIDLKHQHIEARKKLRDYSRKLVNPDRLCRFYAAFPKITAELLQLNLQKVA